MHQLGIQNSCPGGAANGVVGEHDELVIEHGAGAQAADKRGHTALALGIGLGAAGAGAGIGMIFGSMIQSVARQPELRGELQGLMWLGFALTEAVVFYGFLGSLLGFVLV